MGWMRAANVRAAIERYGRECAYCGGPYEELDHIVPVALGGTNAEDNLAPACRSCNQSKRAKAVEAWLHGGHSRQDLTTLRVVGVPLLLT